jgi:hypothetical protein
MTQLQVQTLSNQELNRKLAELMGWTVEMGPVTKLWRLMKDGKIKATSGGTEELMWSYCPDYCTDPAASLEVEKIAIEHDFDAYVQNLASVKWGEPDDDVEDTTVWNKTMRKSIADLLTASPRERAEAAYITLKGELNNER